MSLSPAETYEQFIVPAIFRPWARKVLGAHPPRAGCRLLDVACGTGVGARAAAAIVGGGGHVDGVDLDAGMLAVARRTSAREHDAPLAWCQASAQALPFRRAVFDVVLCLEGLQFFPDRPAALAEVRRVLRGGRFVGTVWAALEHNPAYEAIAEGLRETVSEEAARLPAFSLTGADVIRALLGDAGFAHVSVSLERLTFSVPSAEALVQWLAAGSPSVRHNLALLPAARRQDFSERVAARLRPYTAGAALELPSARHVIVGS